MIGLTTMFCFLEVSRSSTVLLKSAYSATAEITFDLDAPPKRNRRTRSQLRLHAFVFASPAAPDKPSRSRAPRATSIAS